MTSMRVDGDKSGKVWARRLRSLVEAAEADGVALVALEEEDDGTEDLILVYKDGFTGSVALKIWSEE